MHAIATLASHSALQILKGAKDEGFRAILLCQKDRVKLYRSFRVADEIIELSGSDFSFAEEQLIQKKAIIIPHGSFVQYVGAEKCMQLKVSYYGNKSVLAWESNRDLQHQWLQKAGLRTPRVFASASEITSPVIVKSHGAAGGQGYFIAKSEQEFHAKKQLAGPLIIQEYIVGVPVYIHYFYSAITNELDIMGFDRRYETNVDGIGRIPAQDQGDLTPSYVVVGNIPLVIRESLLPEVYEMGLRVVEASKSIDGGLWGPFCLETIITPDQHFFVFEISARIVAGTNPFVDGSPYTSVKFGVPMSTGRRIARDIKEAIERNEMHKVIT